MGDNEPPDEPTDPIEPSDETAGTDPQPLEGFTKGLRDQVAASDAINQMLESQDKLARKFISPIDPESLAPKIDNPMKDLNLGLPSYAELEVLRDRTQEYAARTAENTDAMLEAVEANEADRIREAEETKGHRKRQTWINIGLLTIAGISLVVALLGLMDDPLPATTTTTTTTMATTTTTIAP